jgi:hypothetical protein
MNTPTIKIDRNSACVTIGSLTVWFSYETPIAFQVDGDKRFVRQNEWGPTTGKHLNAIDNGDKAGRIPGQYFEELLRSIGNGSR